MIKTNPGGLDLENCVQGKVQGCGIARLIFWTGKLREKCPTGLSGKERWDSTNELVNPLSRKGIKKGVRIPYSLG